MIKLKNMFTTLNDNHFLSVLHVHLVSNQIDSHAKLKAKIAKNVFHFIELNPKFRNPNVYVISSTNFNFNLN